MEQTKKKKKKKWIIIGIIVAVIIVILVVANLVGGGNAAMPVTVADVTTQDVKQTVEISGTVKSEESITYFAKASTTISELNVEDGSTVEKGASLVTYDTTDLEANLKKIDLDSQVTELGADATITTLNEAQNKAAEAATSYEEAVKYVQHYTDCVNQVNGQIAEGTTLQTQQADLAAEIAKLEEQLKATPDSEKTQKSLKKKSKEYDSVTKKLKKYDLPALQASLEACSSDLSEYKAQEAEFKAAKEATDASANTQKAQQSLVKEGAVLTKEEAQKELEAAKEGVSADTTGIVSDVQVVKGQTVAEGAPLFTLSDSSKVKVTVELTKYSLEDVKVGQKAELTINGNSYTGEVAAINKVAKTNQAGATVVEADIHIDQPDDQIYLGVEANAVIEIAEKKGALTVPVECVNYATEGVFCYVIENGLVAKKEVETGITSAEAIEIVSGLSEGDQVINTMGTEYVEGTPVQPISE